MGKGAVAHHGRGSLWITVQPDAPVASWAPRREVVGVGWGLTVLAIVGAVLMDDLRGSLLMGIAALALALLSLFGSLARPRLTADHIGLTVRGLTSTRRWDWREVNVRLVRTRRLGRESSAIEIDAEHAEPPALVLLGRLDLGADPQDVADALLRLRT